MHAAAHATRNPVCNSDFSEYFLYNLSFFFWVAATVIAHVNINKCSYCGNKTACNREIATSTILQQTQWHAHIGTYDSGCHAVLLSMRLTICIRFEQKRKESNEFVELVEISMRHVACSV